MSTKITAKRIRELRTSMGLKKAEFARRLAMTQATVDRWEKEGAGKSWMTMEMLERRLRDWANGKPHMKPVPAHLKPLAYVQLPLYWHPVRRGVMVYQPTPVFNWDGQCRLIEPKPAAPATAAEARACEQLKARRERAKREAEVEKSKLGLDEAIQHAEEKSRGCSACAADHKQLAEWLRELKSRREADNPQRSEAGSEDQTDYCSYYADGHCPGWDCRGCFP